MPFGTESGEAGTPRTTSAGLNGGTPPPTPWPPAQPQSELVQAVSLVARAVQGRIAVLQAEIDQLKRALHPFKVMGTSTPDVFTGGGDDAVNELLNIARRLGGGEKP